jgi:hypothetical protein
MDIKIIGNNSSNRMKLIKNINKALKNYKNSVLIDIIDDEESLNKFKNKNTPILLINNKIISTGKILESREIKKYIEILEI